MAKASVAYFIDVQKKQQLYINMNQNLMTNELVLVVVHGIVQFLPDFVVVHPRIKGTDGCFPILLYIKTRLIMLLGCKTAIQNDLAIQ